MGRIAKLFVKRILSYVVTFAIVFLGMILLGMQVQAEGLAVEEGTAPPTPLTFTAREDNSSVTFSWLKAGNVDDETDKTKEVVKYRMNGGDWSQYQEGTQISLNKGEYVSFKGRKIVTNDNNHFSMTGKIDASGDVTSLVNGTGGDADLNYHSEYTYVEADYGGEGNAFYYGCFYAMFKECSSLQTAPNLPSTILASKCYAHMFQRCENLQTAPNLNATNLAEGCYELMFEECHSLQEAPTLPATTLTERCYAYMFSGCISLQEAPELPATTLVYGCYQSMFSGCRSLQEAPELPATALEEYCYVNMFSACSSLLEVPRIAATSGTAQCFTEMFANCEKLTIQQEQLSEDWIPWQFNVEMGGVPLEGMFNNCHDVNFGGGSDQLTSFTTYYQKHTHILKSQLEGDTLKVYCTKSCPKNININTIENAVSVSLEADNAVYTGEQYAGATLTGASALETVGFPLPTITYKGRGDTIYEESETSPKNAGTYTASITIGRNTLSKDFEITKATLEITTPPAICSDLGYDQVAHELITPGSSDHGTFYYQVNGGEWSTEIPVATEVGEYTVCYYVEGNENYNGIGSASNPQSIGTIHIRISAFTIDEIKAKIKSAILNRETELMIVLLGDALSSTDIQTSADLSATAKSYLDEVVAHKEGGSGKLGDYYKHSIGESGTSAAYTTMSDGTTTSISAVTLTYNISYYTNKTQEDFVDGKLTPGFYTDATDGVGITDTMSQAQKVQAIYHWITNNVAYDYGNLNDNTNKTKYTAYGALDSGKAVCQGFANLFYRMCMDNGIDCRIVTGTANGGAHAWNLVQVDGKYYLADATWDCKNSVNGNSTGKYDYFLRSSFSDHTEDTDNNVTSGYTKATKDYLPFVVTGDVITDLNSNVCPTVVVSGNNMNLYTIDDTNPCYKTIKTTTTNTSIAPWSLPETHDFDEATGKCSNCGKRNKYIVSVTSDGGDNNSVAPLQGGNTYLLGTDVTVIAPEQPGYQFLGWFKGEALQANTLEYTFTLTEEADVNLVAKYEANGDVTLNVTGDGGKYSVNNTTQDAGSYTGSVKAGSKVTVEYTGDGTFLYWKNESGRIVSTAKQYTFSVVSNTNLTAVAITSSTGSSGTTNLTAYVEFVSAYGQILQANTCSASDVVGNDEVLPAGPVKLGGTFRFWSMDGATEATADSIKAAITAGKNRIRLVPLYATVADNYTVTVKYLADSNAADDGATNPGATDDIYADQTLGEGLTVTAKDIEGKAFSHWSSDKAGQNVLSYNKSYFLRISGNMVVYANYVAADIAVKAEPIIAVTKILSQADGNKNILSFEVTRSVPDTYEIIETGVLYKASENAVTLDLSSDCRRMISVSKTNNGVYTMYIDVTGHLSNVYLCGYMIIKDKATGNIETIYTNVANSTYN